MSSPPPTKPPRGVKQGRETSGLLMSVIRTLSASETNEQREKERAKLEKEYKRSDARLDELVEAHAQEIMDVMQMFTSVSTALAAWGARGDAAAGRLAACRGLLRLRRADLRRLWLDARAHHHALTMLSDIELVVVSERQAREELSAGRVVSAARTLQTAAKAAAAALAPVTALHTTRQHLEVKKQEVVTAALKRLSAGVYRSIPVTRSDPAMLLAELTKPTEVSELYLQDITPELEASLSEDCSFETQVCVCLEALAELEQLKEGAEKFKIQIQTELLEVVDSISRRIIEEGDDVDVEVEGDDGDEVDEDEEGGDGEVVAGRPLARLVGRLAEEFEACGGRQRRVLQLWRAALQRRDLPDSCLHTEQNYWSAVQQVVQLLLAEYLAIDRGPAPRPPPAAARALHDYFAKRRPPTTKRTKLYRLPAATASLSPGVARAQRYPLVCAPRPALLRAALPAIHALCRHIEGVWGGGICSLRTFMSDYVRSCEAERLANVARAGVAAASQPALWRQHRALSHVSAVAGVHQGWSGGAVVSAVIGGWACVASAAKAARALGGCGGGEAAKATTHALAALATECLSAQSRVWAQAGGGRAQRWLQDDDIARFLQALPNWRNNHTHQQELNEAYEREAEILGSSLGDGAVARAEIIADVAVLTDVALLCESMEWLSTNIKCIPSMISGGGGVRLPEKFHQDIAAAALIFEEIANKCLLLLHLEVRIECFHYLCQPLAGVGAGTEEGGAGAGAASLAAALVALHEAIAPVLAPNRLRYVLGGLADMMSAAVVWRAGAGGVGGVGGAGGGSHLAALRHCLAALQLPPAGLTRAHDYLHLLNCSPEEIISSIREKGAQFSELEYLNAFKVIGTKRGLSDADLRPYLKQLSSALGHVGVTV